MYDRKIYRPDQIAVYCDWGAGRVVVHDHAAGQAVAKLQLAAREFDCDLSWDNRFLLTTNWHREGIDVWDIPSQSYLRTIPVPFKVGRLICDTGGERVAFLLRKGFYVADLTTLATTKIHNCDEDLSFASFSPLQNHCLVPMLRVGRVAEILFTSFSVCEVALPIGGMARWVCHFLDGMRYAVIDTKKSVHVFDSRRHERLWSTSLASLAGRDHVGVGCVSGDGTIVGAAITRRSSNDTVTLDARDGTILNHFAGIGAWCGSPYGKTLILSAERVTAAEDPVRVFDLATGQENTIVLNGSGAHSLR